MVYKNMKNAEKENGTTGFWRMVDLFLKIFMIFVVPFTCWVVVTMSGHDNRITVLETTTPSLDKQSQETSNVTKLQTNQDEIKVQLNKTNAAVEGLTKITTESKVLLEEVYKKVNKIEEKQ